MTAQSYEKYFTRAIGLRKINVSFFRGQIPPLPAVCYIVTIVTIVTAAIHVARVYIYIYNFLTIQNLYSKNLYTVSNFL